VAVDRIVNTGLTAAVRYFFDKALGSETAPYGDFMKTDDTQDSFPKLTLTAADGAQAEIYLHGAHVT